MMRKLRLVFTVIGAGGLALAGALSLIRQSFAPAAGQALESIEFTPASAYPDHTGNLLINPDFEQGYSRSLPCCNNIAVPIGWNIRWYTDTPPGEPISSPYKYKQPEVKIIDATVWPFCCAENVPPRIHTGRYAVDSFVLFANQDTAIYQSVGHVPIGAVVTASAWLHAWVSSCNPFPSNAAPLPAISLQGSNNDGCPDNFWPIESNHMMVGIDPFGGTDPRASTVVWNRDQSHPQWWGPYDYYSATLPAVAVAQAHTVTMFLRGVTNTPTRFDDIYFDTASLTYSFPIAAGVEQDQPWPLPVMITITVQSPVSLTQVVAAAIDPNGLTVPLTFINTSGGSLTYTSRWRFKPVLVGQYVFTLTTNELADPLTQLFVVRSMLYQYDQDYLLPAAGAPLTESVAITFTLYSPVSLTQVTAVLTDPVGAQMPITFTGVNFISPTYIWRWRFAPLMSGLHTLGLTARQFAQPWPLSILAVASRVYLPVLARRAGGP